MSIRRKYVKNECKHKVYIKVFNMMKYKNIEKYGINKHNYVYVGRTSEKYYSDRTQKFIESIKSKRIKNKLLIEFYENFIEYYLTENNLERTESNIEKAEHELFYMNMQSSFIDAESKKKEIEIERRKILEFKKLSDNIFIAVSLLNSSIPKVKKNEHITYNADIFLLNEKQIKEQIKELKENKKLYIV